MSRSGYHDDFIGDEWSLIMWRGAVASAIRGKRGQAFLKEMLAALDAMPERMLIAKKLEAKGAVCALGSVGKQRGMDMTKLDPEDRKSVAGAFGIAHAMVCEIVYINDDWGDVKIGPTRRYELVRNWIVENIK